MKALSVKQPYASLIVNGYKTVEVRSWRVKYRGPLLICSTAKPAHAKILKGVSRSDPRLNGKALGIVELFDIRPMRLLDYGPAWYLPNEKEKKKLFAWVLVRSRKIEAFPVKGQQGLFEVEGVF